MSLKKLKRKLREPVVLHSKCCLAPVEWEDAPLGLGEFMEIAVCSECKHLVGDVCEDLRWEGKGDE